MVDASLLASWLALPTASRRSRSWRVVVPVGLAMVGVGIAAIPLVGGFSPGGQATHEPQGTAIGGDGSLVAATVGTNLLIGLAYIAVSATLVYLAWTARRDTPFQRVFLAFGAFIVACGAGHLMGVITLLAPAWGAAGWVNYATAVASIGTAVVLPSLVPKVRALITAAKVSEERRQELEATTHALRQSEARLRESQAIAGIGSWEWDVASGRVQWSDEFRAISGRDTDAADPSIGDAMTGIQQEERSQVDAILADALVNGQPFAYHRHLVRPDGSIRLLHVRGKPVLDDRGRVHQVIGTGQDITERQRLEDELRAAKEGAEEANRLRAVFLSTVTHELRTPMTSIRGYVELLLDGEVGDLTPDQVEFLTIVDANVSRLTLLINDVLDLAKIDAGRMVIAPEPVAPARLVKEVQALLVPQAQKQGLALAVEIPPDLPAAWCDPHRTHQILLNLAGNAVKFTDKGSVDIRVQTRDDWLEVAVADTGPGISREMLRTIFDEYRQGDGSMTRRHGGTGLGLAIARKLAELQGGEIMVTSEVGVGSTFTLRLPLASVAPGVDPTAGPLAAA